MKATTAMNEAIEQAKEARAQFLAWDEQELHHHAINGAQKEIELKQERDKLMALRITMRSSGDLSSRDYKEVSARIGSIDSELEDIVYARQMKAPQELSTQLAGIDLYREDVEARQQIIKLMVQDLEGRLDDILAPLYHHLSELEALERALVDSSNVVNINPGYVPGFEPNGEETESWRRSMVRSITKRLEESELPAFEPTDEQAAALSIATEGPNTHRLNHAMIGSPSRVHSARVKAEEMAKHAQEQDRFELERIAREANLVSP